MATPSKGSNRQTLVLDREAVIEAVAALDAANSVFLSYSGGVDTTLGDFLSKEAWTLHAAAFGEMDEEAYASDPAMVDVYVRSYQMTADLLAPIAARAKEAAEEARQMAEAGTIELRPAVDPRGPQGGEPR